MYPTEVWKSSHDGLGNKIKARYIRVKL